MNKDNKNHRPLSPQPNCSRCQHFFVTWDKHTPKGCHFYGIKSVEVPTLVIQKTTGHPCLGFTLKKIPNQNSEKYED